MNQQLRPSAYEFGDFRVEVGTRLLLLKVTGRTLPLSARALDMLIFFLERPGELLDKSSLMAAVWPKVVVEENNLNQHISALRRVLGERPDEHRFIVTIPGRGYRFVAAVRPITQESAPAESPPAMTAAIPAAIAAPPPALPATDTRERGGRSAILIALLLALLLTVAAAVWRWTSRPAKPEGESRVSVSSVPVRSIAVLPFANLSSDASARMLALGISEAVIHELASHNQLMVIARSSSFAFEGRNVDARQIGRELNARYLLEGSLQNQNSRLRVTAELVDAQSGAQVFSMKFDRAPTDVFALQDEIAASVERALEQSVIVSAVPGAHRTGTANLEAWLAYQQGRSLAATRRLSDIELAEQRFADTVKLDPTFALGYVARAEARAVRSAFFESDTWLGVRPEFASDAERLETQEWLARAIAIDPSEGTAYTVRAWLADSATAAEADYRKGLALSPNDAVGYERFAKLLYTFYEGQFISAAKRDEAFAKIDQALELNPLSVGPHITKALMMNYGRGDTAAAGRLLLRALELQPNYYPAIMRLAEVRYFDGETAEAIRYAEQALSLEPRAVWVRHYLARMYLELGDTEAVRQLIAQGDKRDTLLGVPVRLYQHDWRAAAELAVRRTDFHSALDLEAADFAIMQRARATRDFEGGRSQLEEWARLTWDESGNPHIEETNLDYCNYVALAEVLRWMRREDSATRLLHEVLRMLDHGSHELKRGEHMFGDTRATVLALLGDKDGALASLQEEADGVNEGMWWYALDLEPAFEALRHDSRFEALRARIHARFAVQRELLQRMRESGQVPGRRPI